MNGRKIMKGWIAENKELKLVDLRKPRVSKNAVLMRTEYTSVCGSDAALVEEKIKGYKKGTVLGHEYCGIVKEVGENADQNLIGKMAAVNPYIPCKKCDKCAEKKYNLCENLEIIGTHRNGGFAEYSAVPADNLIIIEDLEYKFLGCLIQPVACSLHAVRKLGPDNIAEATYYCQNSPSVVVFGGGPMGLLIAYFCRIKLGAGKIFLVEKNKIRRERYGSLAVDEILDPEIGDSEMLNRVISKTNGGADIVVDAVGNLLGSAYRYVKEGGKVLLFGLNSDTGVQFDLTKNEVKKIWNIGEKRFHIIGSYLALPEDFKEAVEWLETEGYRDFLNHLIKQLTHSFLLPNLLPMDMLNGWFNEPENGKPLKPIFHNLI